MDRIYGINMMTGQPDESTNQIAIFGRRGARPFNFDELRRMYLINGQLFTVTDEPNQTVSANQLFGVR